MPVTIRKMIRDSHGLIVEVLEEVVAFDSIAEYERAEFLEAFHGGDQPRFDALVKRRLEEAVRGVDWRIPGNLERVVRTAQEKMNGWLREDWQERGVNVGDEED